MWHKRRAGRLATVGSFAFTKPAYPKRDPTRRVVESLIRDWFVPSFSVGNIRRIHMSGDRIKAPSRESRMKRVAPSARQRVDLQAALAMKTNNTIERYSLEEREQI